MSRRTRVMVYWAGAGKWEVWERGRCKVVPTRKLRWTAPGRMVDGLGGKAGYASYAGTLTRDGRGGYVIAPHTRNGRRGRRKERRPNG